LHDGKVTQDIDPATWKETAAKPGAVLWIDVQAPKRKIVKALKDAFGFDDISLEDTRSFSLLPKLDTFPDYAFVVIHALGYDEASGAINRRELDFFIGKSFLITVHLEPIPVLDKVFKEAERSEAVLSRGPSILTHVIIDRLIDLAYQMVEVFDDDIEEMERRIAAGQLQGIVDWQLKVRRALLLMKKSIGPQRDVLNELARRDSPLISRDAAVHFRDDYDRLARVYDQVDTNRDLVSAASEAYRSMVSLKINEVTLKTNAVVEWLSLVATIFLPLTFIVGIYGMNFHNMPELSEPLAYPALLLFMALLGIGMWQFFERKGWIRQALQLEKGDFMPSHHEPPPPEEKRT